MNILEDLNKDKGYVRCPHCGYSIKREGKLVNSKLYHNVCANKVVLRMACRDSVPSKRIFIAG